MNRLSLSPFNQLCRPPQTGALRRLFAAFALIGLTAGLLPAQSLWKDGSTVNIVADKRAAAVGDILTILVQESATASKNNSTSTSKKTALDASIATFLYSPTASGFMTKNGQMPAMKMGSANTFDGGGKINNSEIITARIAVRVVDVLPNSNLIIEGTKQTSFSGESQEAVLRGVVRPQDITANNTVFSYNVSDASIKYVSKGTITDAQRKGWFTKIWDKLSPF
jgi:flagellar L-ring protein FlgH